MSNSPATEGPATETPATENTATQNTATEDTATENAAAENTAAENSAAENMAAVKMAAEMPAIEMPVITDAGRVHLHWALTDYVGPMTFSRLIEHFGDAEAALHARTSALRDIKGIGIEKSEQIARSRDSAPVDAEIAAAAEYGVRIICRADPDYPAGLRRIPDAPIVLYVKGDLRDTDTVSLAIVGSRRCTIYGSEQARRFGELLAGAGFVVVSGLAYGIDAFAHHGAVECGGRSIAVMGRGLTEIYPPQNIALAHKILEQGAWIAELPMRAMVRAENFPGRNRLIAGMTLGTLVIEAAQRSGALITARLASEYNREVFAIPGRVQDPMSFGTNALIRDGGAKLVMTLEDILNELGPVGDAMRPAPAPDENDEGERGPLSRDAGECGPLARSCATAVPAVPGECATAVPAVPDECATAVPAVPGDDGSAVPDAGAASPHAAAGRQAPKRKRTLPNTPLFSDCDGGTGGPAGRKPGSGPANLTTAERRVYQIVGTDEILLDMVLQAAELPAGEVLAAITSLELKGLLRRLPGNLVARRALT